MSNKKVTAAVQEAVAQPVEQPVVKLAQPFKFETRKISDGREQFKCGHCGKWLFKGSAIEAEQGDYCRELHEELGLTDADLKAHRLSMTVKEVPAGYMKLSILDKICKRSKPPIPISKMVAIIGGDRVAVRLADAKTYIHPWFQVVYVGNTRWLPEQASSEEGLKMIREFQGKAPKAASAPALPAEKATSALEEAILSVQ